VPALELLEEVARGAPAPRLTGEQRERIAAARAVVERAVAEGRVVYGVTTGFGQLSDRRIAPEDTARLQVNLVRSHAVGMGEPLPREVVRAMMFLLASSLARGHSGVRPEVVELLHAMLERDVVPEVPSRGSVGSSGDLAPLAHLALALIGETGDLAAGGLEPVELTAKEGLALINGTHLMAGAGALAVREARRLVDAAVLAVALSLEAFKGSTVPFDERLHAVRPQPGQQAVAARLRELLDDSEIVHSHEDCGRVQDPYTLRCAPQVLGAVSDALDYVHTVIARECDAVTDNPLVFGDEVLSGGNFHGQPLSLALDHLALAMCELASFSERRTYALLSPGYAGLPPFLTPHPGLSSGLMIVQYAQAALVNECQVLAHPAGAGSIPTSAGQEDFNSMGAWAALKARRVVELAAHVVASELVCACQGISFHRPLRTTPALEAAVEAVASIVPPVGEDRSLSAEITDLAARLRDGRFAP
jgi:histidine ammonia-lyase